MKHGVFPGQQTLPRLLNTQAVYRKAQHRVDLPTALLCFIYFLDLIWFLSHSLSPLTRLWIFSHKVCMDPGLFGAEGSQLRWLGELIRMPLGCLPNLWGVLGTSNWTEDPGVGPGLARENIYPVWPWSRSGSHRRGHTAMLARGRPRIHCSVRC